MKSKLMVFAIVTALLLAYYLYLIDAPSVAKNESLPGLLLESDQIKGIISNFNDLLDQNPGNDDTHVPVQSETAMPVSPTAIQGYVNIYGTIVDQDNQPIENALISEEYRFASARSDAEGRYQISVKLTKSKNPVVNIMRSGYREERVWVGGDDLGSGQAIKLDVSLSEANDTTSIHGWIGNDIGEGIAVQKIRITSRGLTQYVVSSDERGDFSFEGVRSGLNYRLEVFPEAQYLRYLYDSVEVTHNTPFIKVILTSINLVDINGMVVSSAGVPVPDFEINVRNTTTNSLVRMVSTDSSGFFKLDRFPAGELLFSTAYPEYFKITGVTLAPNETRSLNLVIDKGTHYLSGWVSDQNGVPVDNAKVTLDAEINRGTTKSLSFRSRITNSVGAFSFADLGNETHVITVYAQDFKRKAISHRLESPSEEIHITLSSK